jgi:GntR family transcriptional regulator
MTPRYRQIADELRADIAKGKFSVGALLPTEIDICNAYEVSRHTARAALRILADDGMVERRQGHGTRVVASEPHRFARSVSSIADLLQYGADTRLSITSSKRIKADESLAALLGCGVGAECIHLHGLRSERQSKEPFSVSDIYRVATKDAVTRRLASAKGAVYAIVDELSIDHIGRVEQQISATHLDKTAARELGGNAGDACLRIQRRYFDRKDAMFLLAISLHRSDDFVYTMDLKRSL